MSADIPDLDPAEVAGPALNGLAQRRNQQWVEKHFANPAAMSPGSIMPPSQFSPADMKAIVEYLLSLPSA